MHPKWRKLLIILLAIAGIVLFFSLVDVSRLLAILRAADRTLLLAAAGCFLAGALMFSFRWRYVLQRLPAFRAAFYTDSIAALANVTVHIPAPATRVVAISRVSPVPLAQATSGIVVERLYEQIMRLTALVLTVLLAVSGSNQTGAIIGGAIFVVGAMLLIYWLANNQERVVPPAARGLSRLPRLDEAHARRILEQLLAGLSAAASPGQLLGGLALSLVVWACFYLYQLLTLAALDQELAPATMAGMAMLALAVAPPSAPAMVGIYHGVVIGALSIAFPADLSLIAAYALLLHAVQLVFWGVTGLWGLSRLDFRLGDLIRDARSALGSKNTQPAGAHEDTAIAQSPAVPNDPPPEPKSGG